MTEPLLTSATDFIPVEDQSDRNLVVLLLDTSGSMSTRPTTRGSVGLNPRTKIDILVSSLTEFLETGVHQDSLVDGGINRLEINGEIAIGAFREVVKGNVSVKWLPLAASPVAPSSPFYYVQQVRGLSDASHELLKAEGRTPMAEAIAQALDVIEARKGQLLEEGLTHECRPNLYLLTDGEPSPESDINSAIDRLHAEEDENRVLFWAFGTDDCNRDILLQIANKPGNCRFLGKRSLASVLSFLAKSMRHQPGTGNDTSAQEIYRLSEEWFDDEEMHDE